MVESQLADAYHTAVLHSARRRIGVMFRPRLESQFSAFFMSNGDRRFIVTAQHCVESLVPDEPLLLGTFATPLAAQVDWSVRQHFPPRNQRDADAAAIEVDQEWAARQDVDWIDIKHVGSRGVRSGTQLLLAGFPIEKAAVVRGKSHGAAPFALFTKAATFPRGLQIEGMVPDRRVDIFVRFGATEFRDAAGKAIPRTEPHGMSGCPVFLVPPLPRGTVWSPHRLRLVGLQSSLIRQAGLLVVKRIEHVDGLLSGPQSVNRGTA